MPGFLWISYYALFPFADFALYCFAIINHSHEYDCMLNPVSPSSESLNLWVVLQICNTVIRELSKHSAATSSFMGLQFLRQIWVEGPRRKLLLKIREANKLWQPRKTRETKRLGSLSQPAFGRPKIPIKQEGSQKWVWHSADFPLEYFWILGLFRAGFFKTNKKAEIWKSKQRFFFLMYIALW